MEKKLKAFVSASASTDIASLRNILRDHNVEPWDAFDTSPADEMHDWIVRRIRDVDFAVIVLQKDASYVWYEMGLCFALKKPMVLIAPPEMKIPAELQTQIRLRSESTESDLLRITIGQMADDIRKKKPKYPPRKKKKGTHTTTLSDTSLALAESRFAEARTSPNETRIFKLVTQLFQDIGLSTVNNIHLTEDKGAHLAVWSDDLQYDLGNPLFVEIKTGSLSKERLSDAQTQLISYINKSEAKAGLLLYLDREGRRFAQEDITFPCVFWFDLQDFAQELSQTSFPRLLLDRRNKLVHGVKD